MTPGTPDYDSFFGATQTVIDSADPVNWALAANNSLLGSKRLLLQEVVGSSTSQPDQVIPNAVPGAPLSGTEPLIRVMVEGANYQQISEIADMIANAIETKLK